MPRIRQFPCVDLPSTRFRGMMALSDCAVASSLDMTKRVVSLPSPRRISKLTLWYRGAPGVTLLHVLCVGGPPRKVRRLQCLEDCEPRHRRSCCNCFCLRCKLSVPGVYDLTKWGHQRTVGCEQLPFRNRVKHGWGSTRKRKNILWKLWQFCLLLKNVSI